MTIWTRWIALGSISIHIMTYKNQKLAKIGSKKGYESELICEGESNVRTFKQATDARVVQTEVCTHFATHIFSETVSIFAIAQP